MEDPELEIPRDFILLGAALFAILHVDAHNGEGFPLVEWLKFRHYTGENLVLDESTITEVLEQAAKFLPKSEGTSSTESLRSALSAMKLMRWTDYSGFQYLQTIRSAARGEAVSPESIARINHWADFRRRLERRANGEPIREVNRQRPICVQDGCSSANIRLPGLRPIESLMPCICSACGTALIPDLLNSIAESYEN